MAAHGFTEKCAASVLFRLPSMDSDIVVDCDDIRASSLSTVVAERYMMAGLSDVGVGCLGRTLEREKEQNYKDYTI